MFDWINTQVADARTSLSGVGVLVITVYLIVTAVRSKLGIGSMVVAGVAAMLAAYFILNGGFQEMAKLFPRPE